MAEYGQLAGLARGGRRAVRLVAIFLDRARPRCSEHRYAPINLERRRGVSAEVELIRLGDWTGHLWFLRGADSVDVDSANLSSGLMRRQLIVH